MAEYASAKRRLVGGLAGTVLEIGAGNGANFGYLPAAVSWVGLEPDRRRRRVLARTVAAYGRGGDVLAAAAEDIPLADASVDAVLGTIVLCSVPDQVRVLDEVVRVLRPGGAFVFFEHVAAPQRSWSRRAQRLWAPVSRRFDHGCDPSLETWRAVEQAGFANVDLHWYLMRGPLGVRIPYIAGRAER